MVAEGTVVVWHDEAGWGVVECAETPGGCWTHYSALAIPGYRSLEPGQAVHLEHEPADQDGYHFRATRVRPRDAAPAGPPTADNPSIAYRSTLTVTRDDEPDR